MYRGHTEIGEVWDGNVQCDHSGAFVKINARGTWIVANSPMGGQFGFARLVWVGRWAIYDTDPASVLVGLAVRRTPRRWDVFRRPSGRFFGYTLGPEGSQAATALLTICQQARHQQRGRGCLSGRRARCEISRRFR
jgi:hypothetical protein